MAAAVLLVHEAEEHHRRPEGPFDVDDPDEVEIYKWFATAPATAATVTATGGL